MRIALDRRSKLGLRLIAFACAALLVALVVGSAPARELVGGFGDRPIELRDWMVTCNTVLLTTHLVLLAPLAVGIWLTAPPRGAAHRLHIAALMLLAVTVILTVVFAVFPWIVGHGPFAPASVEVRALRVFVFLPPIVRTLALGAVAWGLFLGAARSQLAVLVLSGTDLALCIAMWIATPKAVIALLHPCMTQPVQLLPALTLLAFVTLLARRDPASHVTSR
jgi:hypothetical protein